MSQSTSSHILTFNEWKRMIDKMWMANKLFEGNGDGKWRGARRKKFSSFVAHWSCIEDWNFSCVMTAARQADNHAGSDHQNLLYRWITSKLGINLQYGLSRSGHATLYIYWRFSSSGTGFTRGLTMNRPPPLAQPPSLCLYLVDHVPAEDRTNQQGTSSFANELQLIDHTVSWSCVPPVIHITGTV